jgi:hypothetical protein
MNSTHAAVSDHEEIASVALRHVDEPAFGAPRTMSRVWIASRAVAALLARSSSRLAKLSMSLRPRVQDRNTIT